jgi:4-diphosphocytidyl-2-C-methyl-D-erythritol kinase
VLKLKARAKINLNLQVIGLRSDGYHEIDSVMQSVSLHDNLTLSQQEAGITVIASDLRIPSDARNTAHKAARVFFDKTGVSSGVKIEIEKNIPIVAGLAGGSSDAAAVLVGLNKMFKTGLTGSDLINLAAEVGSDVPFCVQGGTARCRGRGEIVEKIDIAEIGKLIFIIVKPEVSISTKWVYENFDRVFIAEGRLAGTHQQMTGITLYNDLEKVVLPKYPEVEKIKKRLIHLGCPQALMSGSGSAVFGLTDDEQKAQAIYREILKEYPRSFLVYPVPAGVL